MEFVVFTLRVNLVGFVKFSRVVAFRFSGISRLLD